MTSTADSHALNDLGSHENGLANYDPADPLTGPVTVDLRWPAAENGRLRQPPPASTSWITWCART